MRVQEQTKKHKDNFNKKDGILLSDNKQDEMMANVLDLYPKQPSYLLIGEGGAKKLLVYGAVGVVGFIAIMFVARRIGGKPFGIWIYR